MERKWTGVCSPFLSLVLREIAQRVIVLLEQEALEAGMVEVEVASAAETTVEVTEADTNPTA
jgi:hypothetical protein